MIILFLCEVLAISTNCEFYQETETGSYHFSQTVLRMLRLPALDLVCAAYILL